MPFNSKGFELKFQLIEQNSGIVIEEISLI